MKSEKVTQHPSSAGGDGKRSRLGEILVDNGAITVSQLDHALSEQTTLKLPLGQILLKLDYVSDETMRQALGLQLNVPYLDLENVMIDRSLAGVINPTFAKRHSLLPVATVGRTLTIAMDDPTATAVVQDLQRLTGFSVTVVTSSSRAIQRAFRRLYDDMPDGPEAARVESDRAAGRSQIIGAPIEAGAGIDVDSLLHDLLARVLDAGSRDLHLDWSATGVGVRIRIDGRLEPPALGPLQARLDRQAVALGARIRMLCRIEPSAHGPQDGRAEVTIDRGGRPLTIALAVSLMPAQRGDSMAIRLFDRSAQPRGLDALGLSPAIVSRVVAQLARPAGVFLVTGSSTARTVDTLHACVRQIARPAAHIVTVEDPIAYLHDAVTQTEVGGATGLTGAGVLRALARHDVDAIMVGDLDDREAAALAFRAAALGRLVLGGFAGGTAAVDVVPSLLDLGVPASAIAQSLAGVLRQPLPGYAAASGMSARGAAPEPELWIPDDEDADLIRDRAPFADLRRSARRTTVA